MKKTTHELLLGDCLDILPDFSLPENRVDLIVCSPPYENVRTYDQGFNLKGQEWVDWCVPRYEACLDACSGLVAWVAGHGTGGVTTPWSGAPWLLGVDLLRRGHSLLRPHHYGRHGTPGSGGRQWFSAKLEYAICATSAKNGKLPYADPLAFGLPPKYDRGGGCTNRTRDGSRVQGKEYAKPKLSNPGNVTWESDAKDRSTEPELKDLIWCGAVGGGNIGDKIAHKNEAPFPEYLAEVFITAFCPPGGWVLDCFAGSGTVAAMAKRLGRNSISIDNRKSQLKLIRKRLKAIP